MTEHKSPEQQLLRDALKWALRGHHVTEYTTGFAWRGCGCCSYDETPPRELDALLREVRYELLDDMKRELKK